MAKTKEQKQQTVQTLKESLAKAKTVFFADFAGLKVKDINELRDKANEGRMSYTVSKKSLINRAFKEEGVEVNQNELQGNIGILFSYDDEVAGAKLFNDFSRTHEALKILGGIFEKAFIGKVKVLELARLPGKQELLAKLVGSLNAPISGLVNVLAGNLRGLVTVLNQIKEKKN